MAENKREKSKEEVYAQRQSDYKEEKEKVFKQAQKEAAKNDVVDPEKIDEERLEKTEE